MGRQVRRVGTWKGWVECHLHSNHVIHRLYRWGTYHSHPTMKIGNPFKWRWTGRPQIGMLFTPDIIQFKIPVPFAFVPVNENYEPLATKKKCCGGKRKELANAGDFKITQECQKTVVNFNNCLKNNLGDSCNYYSNYLNSNCLRANTN